MLHATVLQQFPALQQPAAMLHQYFLNPFGLLALLALIPLLILYLMRPEPEERVMPSMEFFMEKKRSGKMRKALRTLQRNLLLLLHILFIIGIAGALAEPYIMEERSSERAVIVVDRSASMADDLENVRSFADEHAGERNTLVVVGDRVSVPMEGAGEQRVLDYVSGIEARDVETDIRNGLGAASGYEGSIVLASDLDQTAGGEDAEDIVNRLRAEGRTVSVMETGDRNRWGVVGIEPGRRNSSIDIKNFGEEGAEVDLEAGQASRTVEIPAGAVETVSVPTPPGRTRVSLEDDPVPADNTAFISVPEERSFRVLLISDTGNPHLEKAVELINFTSIEVANPPLNQVPTADVYIIGRTDRILRSTVGTVEDRARDGAGMVVFAQDTIFGKTSALPVERTGDRTNVTVEIEEPRRILIGETPVYDVDVVAGEAAATHNALVRAEYGSGEIVFYNIRDGDFHFDFLYPVFWKDLLGQLTDRPTVSERNLETGEELNFSTVTAPGGEEMEGPVRMVEAGFYETSRGTFASNLVSPDESEAEPVSAETEESYQTSTTERDLQPLAAALLLLMALGEFGYLKYRGSL